MKDIKDETMNEFAEDPNNGCGPGSLHTGKDDPFYAECVAHDYAHMHGGSLEQETATNSTFYKLMWMKVRKNWLLAPRAAFYTVAVALFDRFAWYKKDRMDGE